MTTYTYPQNRTPSGELSALLLFTDPGATVPASITDVNGNPLPGGRVYVGTDGLWPLFQCTSPQLYTPSPDGPITTVSPTFNFASPQPVTGAKGGNAALGSLIAALIAAGVPITDQTGA